MFALCCGLSTLLFLIDLGFSVFTSVFQIQRQCHQDGWSSGNVTALFWTGSHHTRCQSAQGNIENYNKSATTYNNFIKNDIFKAFYKYKKSVEDPKLYLENVVKKKVMALQKWPSITKADISLYCTNTHMLC